MEIGKQIKKYRTEMELSQDDLAERIFVSRQSISNWENNKNYPDIKSLVLLSSLFGISLDTLIKGDLEKMKKEIREEVKTQDVAWLKTEGVIFSILMVVMILSPIPLLKLLGYVGIGIWAVIVVVTIYFAIRIEKKKKQYDIQTYKEIVAFSEGRGLSETDKNREYGKRGYQKFLLAVGAGLLTAVVSFILIYVLR